MPDQYQNFSNPTIIPENKYGWQAADEGLSSLVKNASDYLMKQHGNVQALQLQQAQDLSKFKTLDQIYYGGAHSKQLDDLLSQNPYGRQLVTQGLSSAGQGENSGSTPGSMAAGANMIGMPGMSTMSGQSVLPMPSPSGGGPLTPNNPIANQPVVTSMTQKAFEAPSITMQNPAGEGTVAAAKEYAGKMAGEAAGAQAGTVKDTQQLAMVTNALKPLVQSYDQVYNSKVAGLPAAGDIYGSTLVKHADWIPRGVQSAVINPKTQAAAGQFLANKNELVIKLQGLLSQQFGKDGSSRIMETLIHMSQNEIGDLNTPRPQFHGQITGTISSLYRIAKAAQAYKQDLQTSGQMPPSPETAAQEIVRRMQLQSLQPQEQQELQNLINDTLGNQPQQGSMNPVMSQTSQAPQQGQDQGQGMDMRSKYNELRASGVSKEDAKRQLGL